MLITEEIYKSTFTSKFINTTESADNFNSKVFDDYIENNLIDELGIMRIAYVYDTKDKKYRHVVFNTEIQNKQYIVLIDLSKKIILGHYILELNREYGIKS